jgi:hypothetical protein
MANGKNEYTGKIPADLVGKSHFVCQVSNKRYPITALDWHHICPQAGGGSDDNSNFIRVETGMHQFMHKVARSLGSARSDKTPADQMAREYAESVTPNDVEGTKNRILLYAVQVASAMSEKKYGKIAVGDSDIVIKDIPPRFKKLGLELGKRLKKKDNKPLGVSGIALVAFMGTLEKHYPEESDNIQRFLADRGVCHYAPRPKGQSISFRTRS